MVVSTLPTRPRHPSVRKPWILGSHDTAQHPEPQRNTRRLGSCDAFCLECMQLSSRVQIEFLSQKIPFWASWLSINEMKLKGLTLMADGWTRNHASETYCFHREKSWLGLNIQCRLTRFSSNVFSSFNRRVRNKNTEIENVQCFAQPVLTKTTINMSLQKPCFWLVFDFQAASANAHLGWNSCRTWRWVGWSLLEGEISGRCNMTTRVTEIPETELWGLMLQTFAHWRAVIERVVPSCWWHLQMTKQS